MGGGIKALNPSTPDEPGWLEISIRIAPIAHEALSAFLFDLGCEGVIEDDAHDHALKAYLPFRKGIEDISNRINAFLEHLQKIFRDISPPDLRLGKIEDQDWSRNWRRFFRPDRITQRLMVLPAWESCSQDFEGHVIRIDPGPAFGTGQHPTTRMCLEAMERVPLWGPWSMLDVGTGSGILAIYGAMLGASKIMALDIDPEALRWAGRNIQLNNLSDAIDLSLTPLEDLQERFSMVTANLILDVILELFPHFARVLQPCGWLILSGILIDQVQNVEKKLPEYALNKKRVLYQEEWACFIARKRNKDEAVLY